MTGADRDKERRVVMSGPSNPMAVARELIEDLREDGTWTLRRWRGGWVRWEHSCWVEVEDAAIAGQVYGQLEHAWYRHDTSKGPELRRWQPNRRKVDDVLHALSAILLVPENVDPPTWLAGPRSSATLVACSNGLLDVRTRDLLGLTPRYFNRVAVPFDYDPRAVEPKRWLGFLEQLWPADPDAIGSLQEFFGYVLSGRTDLQKILLLVGPTRSGKGTIARVLTALIGTGNAAGPTLASLATNFGLSPLLGKPLAVVSDARLPRDSTSAVVERLLSISGEDMLTVDRKYREPWSGKLPTRFVVLSNELPRFGDASGAIARRFVVLMMTRSFLGQEDTGLSKDLLDELPGILRWSLDGLDRVARRGSLTEPASSSDAVSALQDLVSPVAAFVRDCCVVGADPDHEVLVSELFAAWKVWCEDNGHRATSTQTFGRDLRAVLPRLQVVRPWADAEKSKRMPRRYAGVRLHRSADDESSNDNEGDRGPKRSPDPEQPRGPQGPQSPPLWAERERTQVRGLNESLTQLPGRCPECGFHAEIQGHRPGCQAAAP